MKKLLIILLSVLSLSAFAQQDIKRVAILETVDRENRLSYSLKMVLRSNMARAVANTIGYEAYDRTDIDAIISEHNFKRTGLVSNAEIRKLGEMTGVSLILVVEGVFAGRDSLFVSAKILNVETAKVEIMDNVTMGLNASSLQRGCAELTKHLLGATNYSSAVEKYSIERLSATEYMYAGNHLDKHAYENFLKNNCYQAYKQYRDGERWYISGWCIFGTGLLLTAVGIPMDYLSSGGMSILGSIFWITGPSLVGLSVIPISIGYNKRNNAYKITTVH